MSDAEEALAFQLRAYSIPYVRECRFAAPRRWRFDFQLTSAYRLAVEVEGGAWSGGHKRGRAADTDCEKSNAAALDGWRVLRFTPAMVDDGRAIQTIQLALASVPVDAAK